jgi:oligopeptidase A
MTQSTTNALLDQSHLPRFDLFDPSQIGLALDTLLEQANTALAQVTSPSTEAKWDAVVEPLQGATERLGRAWGMVGHLNGVADTPALREAYNQNLPRVTEFFTALGLHEGLYAKYKALRSSADFAALSATRQRIIDNALRDFRLGGAELQGTARNRYAELAQKHAALTQKFSENVLDATDAFHVDVSDVHTLDGLPADAIEAARLSAQAAGVEGYRITLQFPSYMPVMQYATNRALREQLYRAYVTRASDGERDNTGITDEILKLRQEEAELLGYRSYADVSLVPKMAESPEQVEAFLLDLASRARPFAQADLDELQHFAWDQLGLDPLQAWDIPFASERLKQARYAFSDTEVKQYFALPAVLKGLFGVIEKLFTVSISPDTAPVWHPDVRFYRIERGGQDQAKELVGQFYIDLYARAGKRPGAWMDDARGRKRSAQGIQTPVAYLTCNFQAPVGEQPARLTHDDVITLFHEFGHGLHHMLTQVDELSVSGISGVEWDAVELPSQFMENFCWDFAVLQSMSAHPQSGEPLPRSLFDKMLAAKNFQSGLQTLRQVEFALFDMRVHAAPLRSALAAQPSAGAAVQSTLDAVRSQVAVLHPPAFNRFQNSFSHIFAGGYAAGYYSYKWAEVLSADCFAAFEETALFDPATGQRFLDEILARGGSRPAIASFRAFRGRDPSPQALLRHNGMSEETTHAKSDLTNTV